MLQVIHKEQEQPQSAHAPGRKWIDIIETVSKDGVEYVRSGYVINGEVSADIQKRHFTADDANVAVLCGKCHNDTFRISFGSYECIATCVECGFSSVVYDG